MHTPSKQHIPQKIADGITSQLANVKLDSTATSIQMPSVSKSQSPGPPQEVHFKTLEVTGVNSDPPHLPLIIPERKASVYKVVIQNGYLVDGTQDFTLFKKGQQKQWKQVLRVLKDAVKLCRNYAIPLCIMDSNKLVALSTEYELGLISTKESLLATMINRADVQALLHLPGQRYKGQDGKKAAANKILATFLMYKERNKYLDYRRRKWAAG